MKIKLVSLLLILLICVPTLGFSIEIYNSVYYEGRAPVKIDGELSDWEFINTDPANIGWRYPVSKKGLPEGNNDLSARFQCFYDSHNLYVAVTVRDDSLVFGEDVFEQSYRDDSVEIYFDGDMESFDTLGFDSNDGQIRVSMNTSDDTIFEGIPMLYIPDVKGDHNVHANHYPHVEIEQYPYIWETLGVQAAIKPHPDGYVMEILMPYRILGWEAFEPNREVGMSVIVNDDDDGSDRESKIGWAEDQKKRIFLDTEIFNRIVFSKQVSLPANDPRINRITELNIETPARAKEADELLWVLSNLLKEKPSDAESILHNYENRLWAQYLLGRIQYFAGHFEKSTETLNTFIDNCPDKKVELWARIQLGIAYGENGEYSKAIDEFETVLDPNINNSGSLVFQQKQMFNLGNMFVFNKQYDQAMKVYDDMNFIVPNAHFEALIELERIGKYETAFQFYDYIEQTGNDENEVIKARIGKARIFYYIGFYNSAVELIEKIKQEKISPELDIETYIILATINQKLNKKNTKF
jgi:tetratricopeptide (TPR) repeat protein